MAGHWISGAIKHPGSFTKQAHAAGESVPEYAEQKEHAKGKTGQRARMALVLLRVAHNRKKPPSS